MDLTDKLSVVGQTIYDLMIAHKDDADIKAAQVFYGDQNKIGRTPALAVETGALVREIAGIGGKGQTLNLFTVFIIVYVSKVQDEQITRLTSEQLAEAIQDVLHLDPTLGGIITHGYVTSIQPGYATRQDGFYRVVRVGWTGKNKTLIA